MDNGLDVLLILITLAVAVAGTIWEKKERRVKFVLIALAVLASIGSIVKSYQDTSSKEFMKRALVSTLAPPNSDYQKMENEIDDIAAKRNLDDGPCHHNNDGMVCLLKSTKNPSLHATLVFNHDEVAQMYARNIGKVDNSELITLAFDKPYSRSSWNEEFVDKVGILGMAVCFNIFHHWGNDYNYDDSFGIKVECEGKQAQFTTDELAHTQGDKASDLFYAFEQRFREQYKTESANQR